MCNNEGDAPGYHWMRRWRWRWSTGILKASAIVPGNWVSEQIVKAFDKQVASTNPLTTVARLRKATETAFPRRALTDAECSLLIERSGEWSVLYRLAIETGLRRGELEKLE